MEVKIICAKFVQVIFVLFKRIVFALSLLAREQNFRYDNFFCILLPTNLSLMQEYISFPTIAHRYTGGWEHEQEHLEISSWKERFPEYLSLGQLKQ